MIAIVILAHNDEMSLSDLTRNILYFSPECVPFLYNSGEDANLGAGTGIERIPSTRRLEYAHIMPFFLDIFHWFINEPRKFDYLINAETDMLFFRRGFEAFVKRSMKNYDYMAPLFSRGISKKSKWRPYRSLQNELENWTRLLGFENLNRAFSPGQIFGRKYVERLLNHPKYSEICRLVRMNKSFTLQEVLNPTLVDFLQVRGRSYPDGLEPIIRYRPYQSIAGIKRALKMPNAYFVHPVRRDRKDPARCFITSMMPSA